MTVTSRSSRKTRSDHTSSDVKNMSATVQGFIQTMSMPDVGIRYSRRDLEKLDHELHTLIALLRGIRNAKQQIHALPPEILTSIFMECQVELDDFLPLYFKNDTAVATRSRVPQEHRCWLNFLHVCRRWRAIIAQAPQLWSTIDLNISPRLFLDRSHHHTPLVVYAGIREPWIPMGRLIKLLNRHSYRIEQLHISCDTTSISSALRSLPGPAEQLRSLTLDVSPTSGVGVVGGGEESELVPALFNDQYPVLKNLTLKYYTPSYSMRNLTRVCLYDQPATRESLSNFLTFLEFSPHLRELNLINAGPDYYEFLPLEDPINLRIVALPQLEELMLGAWSSPQAVSRFLSHISLVRACRLFIWGTSADYSLHIPHNHPTAHSGGSHPTHLLENLRGIERWSINRESWPNQTPRELDHWNEHDITLFAVEDSVLYFRGPHSVRSLVGVMDKLGLANTVKTVCVRESRTSSDKISGDGWGQFLKGLNSLERVSILEYPEEWPTPNMIISEPFSPTILEALTPKKEGLAPFFTRPHVFALHSRGRKKGTSGVKDVITVPCPKLNTLIIQHDNTFRVLPLQSLVTIRGQCGYKLEELDIIHRESRNRTMETSLYTRDEVKELERYVTRVSFSRRSVPPVDAGGVVVRLCGGGGGGDSETHQAVQWVTPGPPGRYQYPHQLQVEGMYPPSWQHQNPYSPTTEVPPSHHNNMKTWLESADTESEELALLLPPSWPTAAMRWTCGRKQ